MKNAYPSYQEFHMHQPFFSFDNEGIRELFVNTFYPVFHGELGILKENA